MPAMQEAGERLAAARAAAEVKACAHRHKVLARDVEQLTTAAFEAQVNAMEAQQAGATEEDIEHFNREQLFYSAMKGYRVGPEANARKALEEALAAGGFASVEEATAAALPAEELEALAARVEAYQLDYATTLEVCQSWESPNSGDVQPEAFIAE